MGISDSYSEINTKDYKECILTLYLTEDLSDRLLDLPVNKIIKPNRTNRFIQSLYFLSIPIQKLILKIIKNSF